jgi:3-oxoacyl-[acyl-carrier protein] reductase
MRRMDLGLHDRVVLVTGSSQGIGRAVAEQFGREGARVAVTYRSNRAAALEVVETIAAGGGDAFACELDLSSPESITTAIAAILARWERIDVLVNNAFEWGARAVTDALAFEALPREEWQPLLRANLEGTYLVTQAVLPSMKQRQWGRIVNISSTVAVDGLAGSAWYGAAKAALHGLTRTLAKELSALDILINVVMPGPTLTARVERVLPTFTRMRRTAPSLRQALLPADLAPLVVFLGSPANRAVTGSVVNASGGIGTPSVTLAATTPPRSS